MNNIIIINGIYFKVLIFFYKIEKTCSISYLMSFVMYMFVLNLFIKVYIIIKDEKVLVIYFFTILQENNFAIGVKSLVDSFTDY